MTGAVPLVCGDVPLVSVVVMSFNRPQALERCLASLAAQTLAKQKFEVVLVDVSNPPNHPQVARYGERLTLRHRIETNRGVAGNRNLGAAAATAPLLAFLDDDCVAHPEWLATLLAAAARHPGALIGGGSWGDDNPVTFRSDYAESVDAAYAGQQIGFRLLVPVK